MLWSFFSQRRKEKKSLQETIQSIEVDRAHLTSKYIKQSPTQKHKRKNATSCTVKKVINLQMKCYISAPQGNIKQVNRLSSRINSLKAAYFPLGILLQPCLTHSYCSRRKTRTKKAVWGKDNRGNTLLNILRVLLQVRIKIHFRTRSLLVGDWGMDWGMEGRSLVCRHRSNYRWMRRRIPPQQENPQLGDGKSVSSTSESWLKQEVTSLLLSRFIAVSTHTTKAKCLAYSDIINLKFFG